MPDGYWETAFPRDWEARLSGSFGQATVSQANDVLRSGRICRQFAAHRVGEVFAKTVKGGAGLFPIGLRPVLQLLLGLRDAVLHAFGFRSNPELEGLLAALAARDNASPAQFAEADAEVERRLQPMKASLRSTRTRGCLRSTLIHDFLEHLLQELKRGAYDFGAIPCARCSPENIASRRTLQKAGFVSFAHMLTGVIRNAAACE